MQNSKPLYTISGVKAEPGNPTNLIRVPDDEAEFFTIYFNDQAVGDFPSRKVAEATLEHYVNLRINGDTDADPAGKQLPPLPVENLSQFAQLIKDWHDDNQNQIALASNPPKEVVIKAIINGKERALSSTERQVFIAGVQVAGAIFKDLPFKVAIEEVEAAVDQSNG